MSIINANHFMGRSGFAWWYGVVEDRKDPEKYGRLRIRILGCHTKDKDLIPTDKLHWAYWITTQHSCAMNGLGFSPTGPIPGTWVWGFFMDSDDMQNPMIIGTVIGIPQKEAKKDEGFNDPRDDDKLDEKLAGAPRKIRLRKYPKDGSGAVLVNEIQAYPYPRKYHPLGCEIKELDVNRIARDEMIEKTVIQVMKLTPEDEIQGPHYEGTWKSSGMRDTKVPIAFGGDDDKWDEPEPWYKGEYPFIQVYESESGHIEVDDDTPNKEGSLVWDRTGTFTEVLTDGTEVHHIVFDAYHIVLKKNYVHIMNDQNERLDKEYNLSIGGRWNVEVFGNVNLRCHKSLYAKVDGDANLKVQGEAKVSAASVSITGGEEIKLTTGGKFSVFAGGSIHMKTAGIFAVDASKIYLNSQKAVPSIASSPEEPKK